VPQSLHEAKGLVGSARSNRLERQAPEVTDEHDDGSKRRCPQASLACVTIGSMRR
jgi:hypothetical protein